jgi:hypothetical protein
MAGALPQDMVKVTPTSSWRPFSNSSLKACMKVLILCVVLNLLMFSWDPSGSGSTSNLSSSLSRLDQDALLSQDDNESPDQDALLSQDEHALSSASKEPTANNNSSRIQNLRMAFVGDSLTRYQYLSFVHYLKTGRWIENEDVPNVIHGTGGMKWTQFFLYMQKLLNGTENCDCHRPDGNYRAVKRLHVICENRYYRHIERNNYISLIAKFGAAEAHGHWDPSQVYNSHHAVNLTSPDVRGKAFAWRFHNWQDIIRIHLAKLDPKPKIVVFNAGMWPHDLHNVSNVHAIRRALDEHGMVGIYKTTTKIKADNSTSIDPYEIKACEILHHCLDMSWTGTLSNNTDYNDEKHFSASVNRRFNEQLINLLHKI